MLLTFPTMEQTKVSCKRWGFKGWELDVDEHRRWFCAAFELRIPPEEFEQVPLDEHRRSEEKLQAVAFHRAAD